MNDSKEDDKKGRTTKFESLKSLEPEKYKRKFEKDKIRKCLYRERKKLKKEKSGQQKEQRDEVQINGIASGDSVFLKKNYHSKGMLQATLPLSYIQYITYMQYMYIQYIYNRVRNL